MPARARRRTTTTTRPTPAPVVGKELYTVDEATVLLSQSRSRIYELLRSGRLGSVREGRSRLIPATAITAYVRLLQTEAAAQTTEGRR